MCHVMRAGIMLPRGGYQQFLSTLLDRVEGPEGSASLRHMVSWSLGAGLAGMGLFLF